MIIASGVNINRGRPARTIGHGIAAISLVNPANPRFGVKRHSHSEDENRVAIARAMSAADNRGDLFSTVFSAGNLQIADARKTRSTRSSSPSLSLLSYPTLFLSLRPSSRLFLISFLFSSLFLLLPFPPLHPLSLSHNAKRVSSDSIPWSRKCESTLLRALKVVLLEGLLLKRPWTVH